MESIPADVLRISVPGNSLLDALPHLQETYCGTMAYEIEHIASHRQRVWLREKIETGALRKPLTADEKVHLLRRLTQVDAFDRFLRRTLHRPEAVLDRGPGHDSSRCSTR